MELDGRLVLDGTRTYKRREVPLPRFLADPLVEHAAGRDSDEPLFTAPRGGPLRNRTFRRNVFDPAVRATGLQPLTPHDLSDTAASLAVSAGANVKVVQCMLGHASAAVTLDVYAGLFSDDLDAVAQRLHLAAEQATRAGSGHLDAPTPPAALDPPADQVRTAPCARRVSSRRTWPDAMKERGLRSP